MGVVTQYRALRRLYYPTGAGVIARIMRGDLVPWVERGIKEAQVGDVVSDFPKPSIPVLLRKGWIEAVQEGGDA